MRRVLLVTSAYKPAMAADMHRVRHLAWELPACGWQVDVLHPDARFQRPDAVDPDSNPLFNPDTATHAVTPDDQWWLRLLNMRSVGWRALGPLARAGDALLNAQRFDLVYISTAHFPLFWLARRWTKSFNVPCVVDYHDPWVRDTAAYRTTQGSLKLAVTNKLSTWMEPRVLRSAAGVVAVSPIYLDNLRQRYGALRALQADRSAAIPFAGSERDIPDHFPATRGADTLRRIVYVGAGDSIMARSFGAICEAIAEIKSTDPKLVSGIRIEAAGTMSGWNDGERKPFEDIAARYGVADLVEERPTRVPYSEATGLAQAGDALLVLGVDEAGYVPSKLFTYALMGAPLLACFRADSPAKRCFEQAPGLGHLVLFDRDGLRPRAEGIATVAKFLRETSESKRFDRRGAASAWLAPAMARAHAELFDRICREHARA